MVGKFYCSDTAITAASNIPEDFIHYADCQGPHLRPTGHYCAYCISSEPFLQGSDSQSHSFDAEQVWTSRNILLSDISFAYDHIDKDSEHIDCDYYSRYRKSHHNCCYDYRDVRSQTSRPTGSNRKQHHPFHGDCYRLLRHSDRICL